MTLFHAAAPISNNNHPPSYIVAATTTITATTTNAVIDSPTNNNNSQTLSDIKLICAQRKKKTKRHIYLTFVDSCLLSSSDDQPCIEIIRKSNNSSSTASYSLNECIAFEYFDTVKNDFQSFIYVYYESYTVSIFFSEENLNKKSMIIKHLDYMYQSKSENSSQTSGNSSQDPSQSQSLTMQSQQQQLQQQQQQQQQNLVLPCPPTTEHILHAFDATLIPHGTIINRDHGLVGPTRLYFTTTDLYIASAQCNRLDLKVTITNQCPSKDRAILCIPYFTIKNYGNRSNIFLIELGKSNYGSGEIHMKCHSSSLASTIHLLVSPVIEERPLILSSAFQNQLLTNKRIEKSKNIHPPIQLNNDTANQSILDSPLALLRKTAMQASETNGTTQSTKNNEIKPHVVVGFFRSLSKNVSNLRRSATFHSNSERALARENDLLAKNKSIMLSIDEKKIHNDQHQIILPDHQKKNASTLSVSSIMTKRTSETTLTSATILNTSKPESTVGTYIDMGLALPKSDTSPTQETDDEIITKEPTAIAEIGVNTMISLSPHVRSAIIVGNSVHLIADESHTFPIGQRSFTSPARVMQPFKTQLTDQITTTGYETSSGLMTSSLDSSNSLQQTNSVSDSHKSLLLSYGIVTFSNNDCMMNDQTDLPTSSLSNSSTLEHRLNSDVSLMSTPQQPQASIANTIDATSACSGAHTFQTLFRSTNNIGETGSFQMRTAHSSVLLFDDHANDPVTTYLLGPPQSVNEEKTSVHLSSFNLTTSTSRVQLSNIDEEKTLSNDPYALAEPWIRDSSSQSTLVINSNSQLSQPDKSIYYADILLPSLIANERSDNSEQQQQLNNNLDDIVNETDLDKKEEEEDGHENNERISTKLYADIDFHQTQRYDRIVQSAAKAKIDDQTPPFVL
ncbi:unnamed protein product [Rotaria socialis]|uniref:IRS-type PTB domain-containing protein n=1 Tax=Rotaria socialis TaxID=392032 RepID=A0A820IF23_9BILA|nr:unnamed protein product [Rotaria socialis]CAF4309187.1 unnamed protein product [Rotaria socialis]